MKPCAATPHFESREHAVKKSWPTCCGYFHPATVKACADSSRLSASGAREVGRAGKRRTRAAQPSRAIQRSGLEGGPSPDSVPNPGGVGFPPAAARPTMGGPGKINTEQRHRSPFAPATSGAAVLRPAGRERALAGGSSGKQQHKQQRPGAPAMLCGGAGRRRAAAAAA
ncbi:hypothetical protein HPB51_022853 [Rhipicephalus microplus]|uniref:Uncharacterized protein n=1 Tax=Rhipicephalus microplus TaxID=6941 RepID=A0A9J6DQY9_RHIMP|nr:hypothetical protein HPB51_022853 [Rhipicephalus microplus]